MTIAVNWADPYEDRRGRWYKGNLHAHSSPASACGKVLLPRVLELYRQAGYQFLALSDHMKLTQPRRAGLTLIGGVEWNSPAGEHTGVYSLDRDLLAETTALHDQQTLLDRLQGRQALVVLNHPNWQHRPHYRREELADRTGYDAVEIYNGVIERLSGVAIATDKWDYLLASGRRVLGMASDDSHIEADIGLAAVVVRSASPRADCILRAMCRGNFYCTSGLAIRDIRRRGQVVTVDTDGGQEIQAIGAGGVRMARTFAPSMSFSLADTGGNYLRFAAYGQGSAMAWTQPFFKD